MQSNIRLTVIIGIVVLLASSSKALIAQQYYYPPAPAYGYAPVPSYGSYQVYPSPEYANGFYEQGYSYPVLPAPGIQQVVPSVNVPSVNVPSNSVSGYSSDSAKVAPKSSDSNLNPEVAQEQKTTPQSEPTGFESFGNALLGSMPSASSILGLENGLEKSPEPPSQPLEKQDLVDLEPATGFGHRMDSSYGSSSSKPEIAAPEVPAITDVPVIKRVPFKNVPEAENVPVESAPEENVLAKESVPEPLKELLELQSKIDAVLPRLLPAVVAVEGGSGVIVSAEGHILTASHVTKKAGRTIYVKLADGRSVQARTLGTNVNSDTAAIKLVGNGPWPYVQIGNSSATELGDWCLALGYPLSFERGQPAAVRIGRILKKSQNRLVTDCPIMGGDSGGPMFGLNGELIAIGSRIRNDISQNLFVPIQKYQSEWSQLAGSIDVPKIKGSQPKSYLGILGETDFDRVRIRRVYHGSPAAKAGLLENDVIVSFGGRRIGNFDDVANVLKTTKPGEEVIAQLNRYGTLINVSVRLGSNGGG